MMIKSKHISKFLVALYLLLSTQMVMAASGSGSGNSNDSDIIPPRPGQGGPSGDNNDADRKVPIDMYTSALLIAGIGLIASYTYFARRRQTI